MSRTRHPNVEEPSNPKEASQDPAAGPENPLYGVAMLKVAMELKRSNPAALEDIVARVLGKMNLSRAAFEGYLHQNIGLLRAITPRNGTKGAR